MTCLSDGRLTSSYEEALLKMLGHCLSVRVQIRKRESGMVQGFEGPEPLYSFVRFCWCSHIGKHIKFLLDTFIGANK